MRKSCQRIPHRKRPYTCNHCEYKLLLAMLLQTHVKELHVKEYPGLVQKIHFVGIELLDNKIVQHIKVCTFNTFLGLNYFIIQEFNPNKKYFLYMSWVELLDNKIVQSVLLNYYIIQKFKSLNLNFRCLN